jgi:mannose-1-phosphate guanylyltransferase
MRWIVVLAGGVGTRFWPLSTSERPKQLLPLAGDQPLLVESVERALPLAVPERVLVVTSAALAPAIRQALPGVPPDQVLAEPFAASTAPALAWATAHAARRDPDASVVSLHADWTVADPAAFRRAAAAALDLAASADVLVTVGAKPVRPEIGYGYVVPGEALAGGARRIAHFVEKPDAQRAQALIADGALWNTGLFAWTARRFRAELEAHTPELAGGLPALDAGDVERFYRASRPVSVDVGVFERTSRGAVLAGDFGWDDVGSWAALRRVRPHDAHGNVGVGDVHLVDCDGCVVWSDEGTTVVAGLSDMVVVRTRGITLVTTAARAPELKKMLDRLPSDLAGERGA